MTRVRRLASWKFYKIPYWVREKRSSGRTGELRRGVECPAKFETERIIMARKIAILGGTGAEGSGLAFRMAKAGEHILIGSREEARAQETARLLRQRIGGAAQVEGLDNPSAAAACDVEILTVPFSRIVALLRQLKSVWKP